MEPTVVLSPDERKSLLEVLTFYPTRDVSVLLHGKGGWRSLSFYALGSRLEARLPYPEGETEKREG